MVKINTEALKVAAAKAVKGIGNLSILAITSAIGIEVKDGNLTLSTTNNSTNLDVKLIDVADKDVNFYACTDGALFTKLVSKTDSDFIELNLQPNCLEFHGTGRYNLALIQDEEGNMARITPISVDNAETHKVAAASLKQLLSYNKLAVSKSFDTPIFTGYCIKDNYVFTCNDVTACVSQLDLGGISVLLPGSMVELFNLFEDKNVEISVSGNRIKFSSVDVTITGAVLEGIDLYPTEQLVELVNAPEFTNMVVVSTAKLAAALDRLALFVEKIDKNRIEIAFGDDSLVITNKIASAGELVTYTEKSISNQDTYALDLSDLKAVVDATSKDTLRIVYGLDKGICVADDTTKYIVPSLDEDEEDGE